MKIQIDKAKKMLGDILSTSGVNNTDVETIVDMLLEQELYKNKFSGFSKTEIESVLKQLKNSVGIKEELVVDKPVVKLIDGKGKSAWLIGNEMVRLVCQMAKESGLGMVGMYNSTYHNIMAYYSRKIAGEDLIGIVLANGGPAAVVPYGGRSPIFGTNPLSYGIPTDGKPIVFDGATAQYAFGTIRLARERRQLLPGDTYLDKSGEFTTDPNLAEALVAFGEYKGYAINLMIDVLTGILVRAKSGLAVKIPSDLGSLFIAIDPEVFTPIDEFKKETAKLVSDIQKVKPREGFSGVYIPGYRSEEIKKTMLAEGEIEVEDKIWKDFEEYYRNTIKS